MKVQIKLNKTDQHHDDSGLPECKGCGRCCKNLDVVVTDGDRVPKEMTYKLLNLTLMKRVELTCVALDEKTNLCTIYENRPTVCKLFNRGNPQCRDLFKV